MPPGRKLDDLSGDGYGVSGPTDGGLNWGREAVNVEIACLSVWICIKTKSAAIMRILLNCGGLGQMAFDSADETLFGMHVIHQNPVTAGQFNYVSESCRQPFFVYIA